MPTRLAWTDPLGEITESIEEVVRLLEKIQGLLPVAAEEDKPAGEWADVVYAMYSAKGDASRTYSALEKVVVPMLGHGSPITMPDGAVIERQGGGKRKDWNDEELADLVASRIVDSALDYETGERTLSLREMVKSVLKYVGVQYWRVRQLSELGIDANQYCKLETTDDSIVVRRPK